MSPEKILSKLAVDNLVTVSCDDTVEDALKIIQDKQLRAAPVVDAEGHFKGMFSAHEIIKNLVPPYIMDGLQTLDFATGASSVLASRLHKMFPSRVGDHVSCEDCAKISSKCSTWEALRMLTKYGSPLPVINEKTGMLIGLISEQSAITRLMEIEYEDDCEDSDL